MSNQMLLAWNSLNVKKIATVENKIASHCDVPATNDPWSCRATAPARLGKIDYSATSTVYKYYATEIIFSVL